MNLTLSPRLKACCDFIAPGDRVADIGCDHGYLGIYLLSTGKAASVIAADVKEMPLQSAIRNAEKYGCKDRMEFYLSDGAGNIPRDFDALVCAGMGADTIISILEAATWLKSSAYRLILQCQSKLHTLRHYLSRHGWHIAEERVVRDGRFLYTAMEVRWEPTARPLTPGQCFFSPALLKNPTGEAAAYYRQILLRLRRAVAGQGSHADPEMVQALRELEIDGELQWMKEE